MTTDSEIWVLGTKNKNADKSFLWEEEFPNLADADVIIVNLNSLTESLLETNESVMGTLGTEIKDKVLHGGSVVFITNTILYTNTGIPNYELCPLKLFVTDSAEGIKINFNKNKNRFSSYLELVKKFDFYLSEFTKGDFLTNVPSYASVKSNGDDLITDNSGHILGGSFFIYDGRSGDQLSGEITFLPPPDHTDIDTAINRVIDVFKEVEFETPPTWINNIDITGLRVIDNDIGELVSKKTTIETKITELGIKKNKLVKFYGLLYSQDKQLEKTVRDAFKLLGFEEIRRIRNPNDEDWVIDLNVPNIELGLIEVKGRNGKTSHADIVQCNKWVDDYFRMDPPRNTKGIFVSNQFRLESFPESKIQRTRFEPNEIEYTQSRKICIIPCYVLFEAVNNTLSGKKKSREELEKIITETNGILTEL